MWIPSASEKASDIATVRIPAIITNLFPTPESRPIITPRVVITPEVNPNASPVFVDSFIFIFYGINVNFCSFGLV